MKALKIVFVTCLVGLLFGCKEQSWVKPLTDDTEQPQPIASAEVRENFSGGAVIKYTLPTNSNALYVKAEYDIGDGRVLSQKASVYNDTLRVEGFVRAGTFDIQLYAVSRAEIASEPITIQVEPSEPPFRHAVSTVDIQPDYGGVLVKVDNPANSPLATLILLQDSLGLWQEAYTEYSSADTIVFNTRGMKNEEVTIGLTVRDQYQNFSDTIFWTGIPLLEEKIDKTKFSPYVLPTDQRDAFGWVMPRLWDDNLGTGFHTPEHPPGGMPQWFTIDLGQTVALSRFVIHQRLDIYVYNHGNPRRFELYGSAEPPSADGEWDDSWQFLGAYEVVKPSGQPPGVNSNEDWEEARQGHGFNFPAGIPNVRYIRFKVLESWVTGFFHLMEMDLYGENEK